MPRSGRAPHTRADRARRRYWAAGLIVFGTLVVAIALIVAFGPDDAGEPRRDRGSEVARPEVIPRPGEGRAPERPGDRGGAEQLATLGAIVGGVGLMAGLAWRSGRRARQRGGATSAPVGSGKRS